MLVDTSAVFSITDPNDQYHAAARQFFEQETASQWMILNATTHEAFTRTRYDLGFQAAAERYDLMRNRFVLLEFTRADEDEARSLLEKYKEHAISFHDALCSAVMLRNGIYRIFTFDRDFWVIGFEVVPGLTS